MVHLYGQIASMNKLMQIANSNELLVLEDSAQACGAEISDKRTGGWGHASGFSFYPGKNLGGLGDGGAITTDDDDLANVVRALGNYGSNKKYENLYKGIIPWKESGEDIIRIINEEAKKIGTIQPSIQSHTMTTDAWLHTSFWANEKHKK